MRTRLVVLVIVPLVVTITLSSARIVQQVGNVRVYDHTKIMAAAAAPLGDLIDRLQDERDLSIEMMATRAQLHPDQGELTNLVHVVLQAQKDTSAAADAMSPVLAKIDDTYPKDTLAAIATAQANMTQLPAIHASVDQAFRRPEDIYLQYNKLLDTLNALNDFVAADAGDQELTNDSTSLTDLSKLNEATSRERGFLTLLAVQQPWDVNNQASNLATLQALEASRNSATADFQTIANKAMQQAYNDTVDVSSTYRGANDIIKQMEDRLSTGENTHGQDRSAGTIFQQFDALVDKYKSVRETQANALLARATKLATDARNTMYLNIGVIIGILIVVTGATLLIARSLTRPLRVLQDTALQIAGNSLPEMVRRLRDADGAEAIEPITPIALSSTDEVGQVARAFDEVHREAVRLATEQAMLRNNVNAMFVNLSRRSQSLVQRQLRLIDELENAEQDPDQLSSLFKLDHLATRMRRNGENLLVLAGEEPGRRWSQPVPLIDVLRAAASEVEQYERVMLRDLPTVEVAGRSVNDVVHLVAELLENATSFSAPETKVTVTGNLLNTGGVMLEIEDSGIGMTPEELDDANERLANPPVVDVAISRRMGLFVVGRLATRHGIQVRLRRSATGGITALVLVPAALLAGNLDTAPAVGGRAALGELTGDTGQQPALTSGGLPRRPGGSARAEAQRELTGGSAEMPTLPPTQDAGPVPDAGSTAGGGSDGWEDLSPAAPPYRNTDAAPPGLAELLAETEAMSTGMIPVIREDTPPPPMTVVGDAPGAPRAFNEPVPGMSNTGTFNLPLGNEGLDAPLAEALDNSATYDFRPGSGQLPLPPSPAETTGQFRVSAGDGDMQLNFSVPGAQPTPPFPTQAPVPPTSGLNLSSSFDDLLPNIPDMEQTGEFAAYREPTVADETDDLLMPEQPLTGPGSFSAPVPPAGDPLSGTGSFGPAGDSLGATGSAQPPFMEPASLADSLGGTGTGFGQPPFAEPTTHGDSLGASGFNQPPFVEPTTSSDPLGASGFNQPLVDPTVEDSLSATGAQTPAEPAPDLSDPLTAPIMLDPSQDTMSPIFNAIESEWFRVRAGEGTAAPQVALGPGATPEAEPRPLVPGPRTEAVSEPAAPAEATFEAPPAAHAPAPAPEPAAQHTAPTEEPKEPMTDPTGSETWQSPGDEGWKAAEVVSRPVAAGLTPKGLPKRVPRTNLVPGSADGTGAAKANPMPIPARSADAVRSRLASFHAGLRQGRDAAGGTDPSPQSPDPNPTASDGPAAFGATEPGKQD